MSGVVVLGVAAAGAVLAIIPGGRPAGSRTAAKGTSEERITTAPTGYTFRLVVVPGAADAAVTGINSFGVMVGTETVGSHTYPFVDRRGHVERLAVAGARDARSIQVTGVDDAGAIVGNVIDRSGRIRGFVRSPAGRYTELTVPAAGDHGTTVNDISPGGVIVGNVTAHTSRGKQVFGFLSRDGKVTRYEVRIKGHAYPTVIEFYEQGVFGGYYADGAGVEHGFYQGATGRLHRVDFPAHHPAQGYGTVLYGVGPAGVVFGTATMPGAPLRSFYAHLGTFHVLRAPGEVLTRSGRGGTAILTVTSGDVVGGAYSYDAAGHVRAVIALPRF